MKPTVLILRTAGTNCDKESAFAFEHVGAQTDVQHINYIKEHRDLSGYQIICVPGGFSYGDDLGAGKILSLELLLWFKDQIRAFIDKGGLILGICNGFQVLVKTGILPDLAFEQTVTLTFNDSGRFESRWTHLQVAPQASDAPIRNVWGRNLPERIALPVAHGEGKFFSNQAVLDTIENRGQVAFRYVDEKGAVAGYPFCPNASMNNIAGITDPSGRVLGLMPHPERFIFAHHWPFWNQEEVFPFGRTIFENGVKYFT